ncbi:kinesin 3 [Perilla frutescens var. hirtella]|uniref:Kinesin 3 n=1 Tax=Perilla frutescens var. hirtella TaxID=608512 RepID=A0AAD4PAU4_PERFH|nr:kinesin 3 [Perilla frutescens var. hirtella]
MLIVARTLLISYVEQPISTDQHLQGVLNMIDLVGSERLSKNGCTWDRLKEIQLYLGGGSKILMLTYQCLHTLHV